MHITECFACKSKHTPDMHCRQLSCNPPINWVSIRCVSCGAYTAQFRTVAEAEIAWIRGELSKDGKLIVQPAIVIKQG